MTDILKQTEQQLAQLRQQLSQGQLYYGLPQKVGQITDQLVYQKPTLVAIPKDNQTALAKIKALRKQVQQKNLATISDAELDFLLAHLGSLDPLVRDKGVYFLFNDILQAHILTAKQVRYLAEQLISPQMLYSHILEKKNHALFLRAFSVVILAGVLYVDRTYYHVLTLKDIENIVLKLTTYLALEADGRGYIAHHGWAHAYSHIGNALDELTANLQLNRANKIFYLTVLLVRYQRLQTPLIFGEDHRLALTIVNLTNKNDLYTNYVLFLLQDWQARLLRMQPQESEGFWNSWYNRNRLLQALLIRGDLPNKIRHFLLQVVAFF